MIREYISEINPEALLVDGFDEAIIGVAERIGLELIVAYDVDKIIEILMKDMEVTEDMLEDGQSIDDLKLEMAYEYFYFNIQGAWMGDHTPIFIKKIET